MSFAEMEGESAAAPPGLGKDVFAIGFDGEIVYVNESQPLQPERRAVVWVKGEGLLLGTFTRRGKRGYLTDPTLGPVELEEGKHRIVGPVIGSFRPE